MKKIPTMFERDWEGDKSRVIDRVTLIMPASLWLRALLSLDLGDIDFEQLQGA